MKIISILKSAILIILYIYFIKFTVVHFINQVRSIRKRFKKSYTYDLIETLFYIILFVVTLTFLYLIINVIYYTLQYNI